MNTDGSNRTRLGSEWGDADPEYSPDGSKIVFASSRSGDNDVYVMNANGSSQVQLTDDPNTDWMPSWSPDGTKIIFVSFRGNSKGIYIMNADGSNQKVLFPSVSPGQPNDPTFNSDGTRIVFSTNNRLNIINVDGTGLVTLPGVAYNSDPDWL